MWKARNSLCFNGGTYEPNDVVNKALFDLHEYDDVVKNSAVVNPISNRIYDVTITLARDGVVFTDAGLQRQKGKASIRMAAIDSCGHLLHAFGTSIKFVGKAITAEALAIPEAVERALQKGWSKVHILSDAKNVIQMLQKNLITSWEIETICEDVWRLMKSFEEIEIIYIPRTWNVLAHNLAKISISCINRISWDSASSSCVVTDAIVSYGHMKHVLK